MRIYITIYITNKTLNMNNENKYMSRYAFTNTIFHSRTTTELTTNLSTAIAKTLGIQSHSQIVEIIVRTVSLFHFHIPNYDYHTKLINYTPDLLHPQPHLQRHRKYLTHPSFSSHTSNTFHSHCSRKRCGLYSPPPSHAANPQPKSPS